jgi:hypothetical protein
MYCCVFNPPYQQQVDVRILLYTTEICKEGLHKRPNLPVGTIIDGGQLHTPIPLSAGLIGKKALWAPVPIESLQKEKFLLPLLDIDLLHSVFLLVVLSLY